MPLPMPILILVLSLLAGALSCAKARSDVIGARRCVSWKEDIGPAFASRCGSCHGGGGDALPAAGYSTSSYAGVIAGGTDAVSNATAGDPDSLLLTVLDPTKADATHQPVSDLFGMVQSWIVACDLSFVDSSVHRPGILDPRSADFHGSLVRDHQYDFSFCQKCHGDDFAGGASKVSCLTCHSDGPTACSTCHGDIASSASHARHLGGGPLGRSYSCAECHLVPTVYTDVGHIFLADGTLDPPPAEVMLGAKAALTPEGTTRAAPPTFDPATQACSNVYCHGAVAGATGPDTAATNTRPVWTAPGTGQADCGSCHGLPPNHNWSTACASCHPSVVDRDMSIIAPDKHIDGQVELGDPAAGCTACHGGPANAAPPPDLTGASSSASLGVGAHQAHLTGAAHLRGPIACAECHRVPTEVLSPGHFVGHGPVDSSGLGVDGGAGVGAQVFPVGQPGPVLASAGGAAPSWDHARATCSGVYCHGGGSALAADTTPGLDRAPSWTSTGGLTCGLSCHGLPPAVSPHLPSMTRTDCASCHPRTVDPSGTLIISGPLGAETSAHINGVIDVAQ